MSHIYELRALKKQCDQTGDCVQHDQLMQQEVQNIDSYTISQNQTTMAWGLFIGVIGLFILLAAFSRPVRHLQRYFLLGILLLAPMAIGFLIGTYASLAVAFTGCFLGICSPYWSMFGMYGPIVVFVALLGFASVFIYKKRSTVMSHVDRIKAPIWIIVGLLVILFAILKTSQGFVQNTETNQIRKTNLSRYM